jgi:hypothetical protein
VLDPFTGIAGTATKGDVIKGGYTRVVDDMLPARAVTESSPRQSKNHTAIDTGRVAPDSLLLKPLGDISTIHSATTLNFKLSILSTFVEHGLVSNLESN